MFSSSKVAPLSSSRGLVAADQKGIHFLQGGFSNDDSLLMPFAQQPQGKVVEESDWILGVKERVTDHMLTMNTPDMSSIRMTPSLRIASKLKKAVSKLSLNRAFEK